MALTLVVIPAFRCHPRASGDLDAVLPMYPVLQAGKRFLQDSDTSEPPGPIGPNPEWATSHLRVDICRSDKRSYFLSVCYCATLRF